MVIVGNSYDLHFDSSDFFGDLFCNQSRVETLVKVHAHIQRFKLIKKSTPVRISQNVIIPKNDAAMVLLVATVPGFGMTWVHQVSNRILQRARSALKFRHRAESAASNAAS